MARHVQWMLRIVGFASPKLYIRVISPKTLYPGYLFDIYLFILRKVAGRILLEVSTARTGLKHGNIYSLSTTVHGSPTLARLAPPRVVFRLEHCSPFLRHCTHTECQEMQQWIIFKSIFSFHQTGGQPGVFGETQNWQWTFDIAWKIACSYSIHIFCIFSITLSTNTSRMMLLTRSHADH